MYVCMYVCMYVDDDFLLCYCDGVLKFLPDIKTIISLRQLLSNTDILKVPTNIKTASLHKKHKTRNTGNYKLLI